MRRRLRRACERSTSKAVSHAHAVRARDHSLCLLDDDPGVQGALELLCQHLGVGDRALLHHPDRGEVGQGLHDLGVAGVEGQRSLPEHVQGADHLVAEPHRERVYRVHAGRDPPRCEVGPASGGSAGHHQQVPRLPSRSPCLPAVCTLPRLGSRWASPPDDNRPRFDIPARPRNRAGRARSFAVPPTVTPRPWPLSNRRRLSAANPSTPQKPPTLRIKAGHSRSSTVTSNNLFRAQVDHFRMADEPQ